MNGLADVDRFKICIQVCVWLDFPPLTYTQSYIHRDLTRLRSRMAIMPILASEVLFRENKKIQLQNATLVSIEQLDL